jgi:hypothetical protein
MGVSSAEPLSADLSTVSVGALDWRLWIRAENNREVEVIMRQACFDMCLGLSHSVVNIVKVEEDHYPPIKIIGA